MQSERVSNTKTYYTKYIFSLIYFNKDLSLNFVDKKIMIEKRNQSYFIDETKNTYYSILK